MRTLLPLIALLVLLPQLAPAESQEKLLRHVVLFSWNEDASPEQIATIERAFAALPSKIESVHSFEWGTDVSVEGLTKGFTHCFVVTFASVEDRAAYLPHPAHQAFVELMKPAMKDVLVLDYWQK